MSMAHHAPFNTYRRKNFVHPHAILRLRERMKALGRIDHRPDQDLGNLIDEIVAGAFATGQVTRIEDRRGIGWLVDLDLLAQFDFQMLAIVRQAHSEVSKKVVVTVVDTTISAFLTRLQQNRDPEKDEPDSIGAEAEEVSNDGNLPMAKLADTPAGAKLALFKVEPPKEIKMDTPAALSPKTGGPVITERVLYWRTLDGAGHYARYQADDLGKAVLDLLQAGIPFNSIEVWAPKKFSFNCVLQENL